MAKVLLVDVSLDFHGVEFRLHVGEVVGRADLVRVLAEMGVPMMDRAEFLASKAVPEFLLPAEVASLDVDSEPAQPGAASAPDKAKPSKSKKGEEK